jgi:3-dehydroquinate synthetase
MGIILAARLGESLGISTIGLSRGLKADFEAAGLPTDCPYPLETLKDAMAKDKKALGGGKVKFVIPVTPGEVVFHEMNPYDLHFDTK